ncbi:MAG TPA: putative lipid II flippase FtsW [bacterium]|nr:putative lipid II flippase FtsW [bacterium]
MIRLANRNRTSRPDNIILGLTLTLVGIGLVMVYSAGAPQSDSPYHYLQKQLLWVVIGVALMIVISRLNLKALDETWFVGLLLAAAFVMLTLVYIPGLAAPSKGAHRWIHLGATKFQPSEFAKGAMVFFFAHYLSRRGEKIRQFMAGVLPMVGGALVFMGMIFAEPDLGAGMMIALLMLVMLFIGGAQLRVMGAGAALGALGFVGLILIEPYRVKRIFAFLHPWADPSGASYQIKQSLVALGRGGIFGVGIGNGFQKLFYLPEIHTDFILANLGEEMGLFGIVMVLALFTALIFRGMWLAMRSKEPFVRFLGVGATALLGMQVIVNAGVVMCLLPTKGLAMPFLSYGGSSALLNFSLVGLILAVGRHSTPEPVRDETLNFLLRRDPTRGDAETPCLDGRNIYIS